ncbi:hypothetical protein C8J57DRAFT_1528396 [Mycena rebaudengoi]|nr:hypothetical protein C8J57DRAFT_1528396 [Mycena rebaudengoi]
MAPVPPDGLTVSTLIAAKGAQLKFWVLKANEIAEEKVMNVSGTVDHLRTNLAAHYGLDLTVIPRGNVVTAPTMDQTIRNRQWDGLEALGVEWRGTVQQGREFGLIPEVPNKLESKSILVASQPGVDESDASNGRTHHMPSTPVAGNDMTASTPSTPSTHTSQTIDKPIQPPAVGGSSAPALLSLDSGVISSSHSHTNPACAHHTAAVQNQAAILDDLSAIMLGLERCDGLRAIIDQIESGEVKKIRDRYGPTETRRRGTAHKQWPKYSGLVSKRERLGRILENDFCGDKEHFFRFFTVPPPTRRKKPKLSATPSDPAPPEEHFRTFRRIVEAHPWCQTDVGAERRNPEYLQPNGEFSQDAWSAKWARQNIWEVWRALGAERYEQKKGGDVQAHETD